MHGRRAVLIELALGLASLGLLILTAVWPAWIEAVFGVDPDGGNGALEWALFVVFATCSVGMPWVAGREWRSTRDIRSTATSDGA